MGATQQALIASSAAVSPGAYLDGLSVQPRCVYGLRRLVSTATLCIRVRNRQTTVETDIGFAGDSVDVSAIMGTFTGTQFVDVMTVYDQSVNGFHLQQSTVTLMLGLVASGVYLGTLRWGGTELVGTSGSLPMGTPFFGVYTRHNFTAAATRVFVELSANASGANPQAAFLYAAASNRMYMYSQNAAAAARQMWADCFTAMVQRTYLFARSVVGTGEFVARQAGVVQTLTTSGGSTEQTGNFSSYPLYVGARADGSLGAVMDLDALAIYDADTSSIVTDIEAIVGVAP